MSDLSHSSSLEPGVIPVRGELPDPRHKRRSGRSVRIILSVLSAIAIFGLGFSGGYYARGNTDQSQAQTEQNTLAEMVNPSKGYSISAKYGDLGPRLLAGGVIDEALFLKIFKDGGQPLTLDEQEILNQKSDQMIVFTRENAHFLLNFFWAVRLSNKNPLLDQGPSQQATGGKVEGLASTGGWRAGKRPFKQIFSSLDLIPLTGEQQARFKEVAKSVYRPCCDNPTDFPDCNHGMAMLGMLELLAYQGASTSEMFQAAKYANAFWFPQQTYEQAVFFGKTEGLQYSNIDPRLIVGPGVSSSTGFRRIHTVVVQKGWLGQGPGSGNRCGL
jgi:hypothetical protein